MKESLRLRLFGVLLCLFIVVSASIEVAFRANINDVVNAKNWLLSIGTRYLVSAQSIFQLSKSELSIFPPSSARFSIFPLSVIRNSVQYVQLVSISMRFFSHSLTFRVITFSAHFSSVHSARRTQTWSAFIQNCISHHRHSVYCYHCSCARLMAHGTLFAQRRTQL